MMEFEFICRGHENILSEHYNTLEFTKDTHLTKRGDCIVGVAADRLPPAMSGKIKITMEVDGIKEIITATANPDFTSETEMVVRKSDYLDARTYAIFCNKAACDLDRDLINALKNPDKILKVKVEQINIAS